MSIKLTLLELDSDVFMLLADEEGVGMTTGGADTDTEGCGRLGDGVTLGRLTLAAILARRAFSFSIFICTSASVTSSTCRCVSLKHKTRT